jgi:NAD(P)H-dependent flavin oxidoreductase YrpB (nitropropane dioxygenase family)
LPELLDVIIEEKAALFVCAVGVPPKSAVEKLHKAGIPIMNVSDCLCHAAKYADSSRNLRWLAILRFVIWTLVRGLVG